LSNGELWGMKFVEPPQKRTQTNGAMWAPTGTIEVGGGIIQKKKRTRKAASVFQNKDNLKRKVERGGNQVGLRRGKR